MQECQSKPYSSIVGECMPICDITFIELKEKNYKYQKIKSITLLALFPRKQKQQIQRNGAVSGKNQMQHDQQIAEKRSNRRADLIAIIIILVNQTAKCINAWLRK